MTRKCPRCNVEMQLVKVEKEVGNIELDACPNCRGIWFDTSELDKILGVEKSFEEMAYLATPLGEKIECPSCSEKMHYSTVKGTTIDFCTKCEGVWLDKDELTDIAGDLPEAQITEKNAPYTIEQKDSEGFINKVRNILSKK